MKVLYRFGRKKITASLFGILLLLLLSFAYPSQPSKIVTPTPIIQNKAENNVAGIQTNQYQPSATETAQLRDEAVVVKVIDGDTINVVINNTKEKIRIIGINTPETDECNFSQAANFARDFFSNSQNQVILEADPTQGERDRYGRLLRFVLTKNSLDYGKTAIESGFAREYTYKKPYQYQAEYKLAETKAQTEKLGIWSTICNSTPQR